MLKDYIRSAKKSKKRFFACKNSTQWYLLACVIPVHVILENAYEVVRKPTTASLYRINLVSSQRVALCRSHSFSHMTNLSSTTSFYTHTHTWGMRGACNDERIQARQEKDWAFSPTVWSCLTLTSITTVRMLHVLLRNIKVAQFKQKIF